MRGADIVVLSTAATLDCLKRGRAPTGQDWEKQLAVALGRYGTYASKFLYTLPARVFSQLLVGLPTGARTGDRGDYSTVSFSFALEHSVPKCSISIGLF